MKYLFLIGLAVIVANAAYSQAISDVKNLNVSFETGFIDDTSTIVYFRFQLDNPEEVDSIFIEMGSETKPVQLRAHGKVVYENGAGKIQEKAFLMSSWFSDLPYFYYGEDVADGISAYFYKKLEGNDKFLKIYIKTKDGQYTTGETFYFSIITGFDTYQRKPFFNYLTHDDGSVEIVYENIKALDGSIRYVNLSGHYDEVIYQGIIQRGFSYKLSSATQSPGLGMVYIQTNSYQEVKKIVLVN